MASKKFKGRSYRARAVEEEDWTYCQLCRVPFELRADYRAHCQSVAHVQRKTREERGLVSVIPCVPKPLAPPVAAPKILKSILKKPKSEPEVPVAEEGEVTDSEDDEKKDEKKVEKENNSEKETEKTSEKTRKRKKETDEADWMKCEACDMTFKEPSQWFVHCRGAAHQTRIAKKEGPRMMTFSDVKQPPKPVEEEEKEESEISESGNKTNKLLADFKAKKPKEVKKPAKKRIGPNAPLFAWLPPAPEPEKVVENPVKEKKKKKKKKKIVVEEDAEPEWQNCIPCSKVFEKPNQFYIHCRGMAHMQKVMEFEQGSGQQNGSTENQTDASADKPAEGANNKVAQTVAAPRIVLSAKAKQAGVAIGVKADGSVDKTGEEEEMSQTQDGENAAVPMEEAGNDDGQSVHSQEDGEGTVAKDSHEETPMDTDQPNDTVETQVAAVPTPVMTVVPASTFSTVPANTFSTVTRISKRALRAAEELKYKSGPEAHVRMEDSIMVYEYEDDDEASATSAAPSADEHDDNDEKPEPVTQETTSIKTTKAVVEEEEEEDDWKKCTVCNVTFTQRNAYLIHVRGIAHHQRVVAFKPTEEPEKEEAEPDEETVTTFKPFECKLCDKTFPRKRLYKAHLASDSHKEKKEGLENKSTTEEGAAVTEDASENPDPEKLKAEQEDDESKRCVVCDVSFTHHNAYLIHVRGIAHHQKVAAVKEESGSTPSEETEPAEPEPEPMSDSLYCKSCKMQFEIQQLYEEHMAGDFHKKKLEDIKKENAAVAKKEKNTFGWYVKTTSADGEAEEATDKSTFFCELCQCACTGIKSWETHIKGKKHMKNAKKYSDAGGHIGTLPEEPLVIKQVRESVDPLIGLDYIIECHTLHEGIAEPSIRCYLCNSCVSLDQILPHVTGMRHRSKYMKYHAYDLYAKLWKVSKSEKRQKTLKFADQLLKEQGPGNVRLWERVMGVGVGDTQWDLYKMPDGSNWREKRWSHTLRPLFGMSSNLNLHDLKFFKSI